MLQRVERALPATLAVIIVFGLLAAGALPVGAFVLSIPFFVIAARKPVLRRLAIRNATRRPRETALIVLGAMLGTAIITGSAIVGDTLGASIRRTAYTQLGPLDETVTAESPAALPALSAVIRDAVEGDERVDGVLDVVGIRAAVATASMSTTTEARRAEPTANVYEIDFAAAQAFGGDPETTGIEGDTPAPGKAAIGEDLADTLDAEPGDHVAVFAYGALRTFEVDRVLPRLGIAGLNQCCGSAAPNLFVAPGTIAALAGTNASGGAPPFAFVAVSNRGGVIDGAETTTTVANHLTAAIGAAGLDAQVESAKRDLLDAADQQGSEFTELFSLFGSFSVIAGVLLLVSIFVMLAEERKTELGMLRAVGLRRSGLVGSFSLEGWGYSLAAAAVGTLAGVLLGRVIIAVVSGIFASDGPFALELRYTATLSSVQRGFVSGFVASLVTVLATSVSISRLNVIRAIRDLPNPTRERPGLFVLIGGFVVALLGVLIAMTGIAASSEIPALIGPPIVFFGIAMVLRRWIAKRVIDTVCSLAALLWAIFCFDILPSAFRNPEIGGFVASGIVLTLAGVFLLSRHQVLVGRVVRKLGGGAKSMSLRLGLAYPLARGFRTSLILMTFSLVMYTLVSITLFSGVFSTQIDDFTADISGGFDAQARSNPSNPAPVDDLRAEDGVELVAPLSTVDAQFSIPAQNEPGVDDYIYWGLAGYDATFVQAGPPSLQERMPRFATELDAWRALLTDPSLVIVDEFFLANQGGPPEASVTAGEKVKLRDPVTGATQELTVAATTDAGFGATPVYMGVDGVRAAVGARAVPNVVYLRTADGVDPQDLAERLNGKYLANGLDAVSFRKLVADAMSQQQQFFRLLQGYLALGLIVGVAGIGVIMIRAVRERRREVGVLRALGFEAKQVRRAFIAESTFVALEGILLGTSLALISTWRLLTSGAFGDGLEFSVPWLQLFVVVGIAFLATFVATASPAQQASKIRPAVALRIAD